MAAMPSSAITPPPGPYAYLTSGALEDIGLRLLANGVFDFGASGTWTWNPTDGWFQPTPADPSNLEPFNGNFVGSGSAAGPVVLGGVRVPIGNLGIGGEIRYQAAEGKLPTNEGFAGGANPRIDLGGMNYLFVVNVGF